MYYVQVYQVSLLPVAMAREIEAHRGYAAISGYHAKWKNWDLNLGNIVPKAVLRGRRERPSGPQDCEAWSPSTSENRSWVQLGQSQIF